jgi:hypothetical protein
MEICRPFFSKTGGKFFDNLKNTVQGAPNNKCPIRAVPQTAYRKSKK